TDGLIDAGHLLARHLEENQDRVSGTIESIHALTDAVRGQKTACYDPGLAVRNLEVLFGMVYSHLAEGRRVHWPIERRGLKITGRIGNLHP
ncbi:MAG: hypothetical protein WC003_14015, partial [Terrimicrobiaceae bacterium]